jgi:hypothetical protein
MDIRARETVNSHSPQESNASILLKIHRRPRHDAGNVTSNECISAGPRASGNQPAAGLMTVTFETRTLLVRSR